MKHSHFISKLYTLQAHAALQAAAFAKALIMQLPLEEA
jgi:hypothetical protein